MPYVMRRSRWVSLVVPLIAFALAGCGGGDQGGGQTQAQGKGGPGGSGQRPAAPPVPVAVEPAFHGDIASYYSATATLEAEKEAEVLARVSGIVNSLKCEEGDRVTKGQDLLHVEEAEYRLRLSQTEAALTNQQARYDRLKRMFDQGLASAEEFETAKNDLQSAVADEGIAKLNLGYTKVDAPFAGRITKRLVDAGQNVSPGTALFVISDFDPLLARVHVPSKEFRSLKPDQTVRLKLDSDEDRLTGRIKLVSPVIDPQTGTIKVTVEIPTYPDATRPGDFAEVQIVTESRQNVLLVPRTAVVTEKSEQVVYVAADSLAERRVVELGFQDDENSQILSGVAEGDLVVVKGQRSLKHGQAIKVLPPEGVDAVMATADTDSTGAGGAKRRGRRAGS